MSPLFTTYMTNVLITSLSYLQSIFNSTPLAEDWICNAGMSESHVMATCYTVTSIYRAYGLDAFFLVLEYHDCYVMLFLQKYKQIAI